MEYKIVIAENAYRLIQIVNEEIAKGWIPLGGPIPYVDLMKNQCLAQGLLKASPEVKP